MATTHPATSDAHLCEESVVFTELDGEAVLLNVESGIYFGLDATGTRMWGLVSEGLTDDEILARLLDEYDVSCEQLRVDIDAFLEALRAQGLVRRAS